MCVYQLSSVIESRPDPSGILWDFPMASLIGCFSLQSSLIWIHSYRTDSGSSFPNDGGRFGQFVPTSGRVGESTVTRGGDFEEVLDIESTSVLIGLCNHRYGGEIHSS